MKIYPWFEKGNQTYKIVLIIQFVLSCVIGYFTDSLGLGIIASLVIIALPLALFKISPNAVYTRHAAVIASQLFVALHIEQSMGATYMHFEIFAIMAVTTVYRDWKVVISSVVVVAVHHFLFYYLQTSNVPVYIFEEQYLTLSILAIHALFAIAEGAILCVINHQAFKDGKEAVELQDAIHKIMETEGQFNLHVEVPEYSTTSKQFNTLISSFLAFINQTKAVAENIWDVSGTVSSLASDVKQASLDTSGQVSTIAAATEEMTANNESVSDRAANVNSISKAARDASDKAKSIIVDSHHEVSSLKTDLSTTSTSIMSLSEKCQQIENVMASITAISDQTNLLALNAAIESARAGEHGRGFAVVADEVRQLAMRTKDNTAQISEITHSLIQDSNLSVEKMKVCLSTSDKVGASSDSTLSIIDEVVASITSVSDNMASVSSAIKEQSIASTEISKSTSMLATTSESLSHHAEQTDVSFKDLETNVNKLKNNLARFM